MQIKAINSQDNTSDYRFKMTIYMIQNKIYSSILMKIDSIDSIDEDDLETVTDNIIGEGLLYYLPRVSQPLRRTN